MKLIVIGITLLNVIIYIQARSISIVGDIRVEQDGDKWTCDMIECPANSARCFVSKSNKETPTVLKRVNICYSKNDEILAQKETTSLTDPNISNDVTITSYRNGGQSVSSNSVSNDFNEKEFNENMEHDMNKLHSDIEQMQENIQRQIREQQQQLQASLSQMQNNLAHMFN